MSVVLLDNCPISLGTLDLAERSAYAFVGRGAWSLSAVEIDAIFIAPTYTQAVHYARTLNYNRKQILIVTRNDFWYKFEGRYPDEDVEIHICGSWFDDDAPLFLYDRLLEIETFLKQRGFDFITVNRIGEP